MSDKIEIRITAVNGTKTPFEDVAKDAQRMGNAVTEAGKRGAQGLQEMERSSRDLEQVQKRATAIGAAAGTIVGGLSLLGRSYVDQEQQLVMLQRAYGSSAEEVTKFSEAIQKNTAYSNDAARLGAIYSSTLIQNYGLTAKQIEQLIARSADLATVNVDAQGKQLELTDAIGRASGAIRGEAEAAELLGVSMSDTMLAAEAAKRGMTGWNTTMTEAEKAQLRFQVFMEQSNYASGAAADYAETNAGKARQLTNEIQDLTQSFGEALGPMGQYLSVLGDLALVAPVVGAGLGRISAGIGALGLGAPEIAALAALVGSGAYAYNLNTSKGGWAENFTTSFLANAAGALNWALPGDPFAGVQQQFLDLKKSGNFEAALGSVFMDVPGSNVKRDDNYWVGVLITSGVLPVGWSGDLSDAADYISTRARAVGVSNEKYVVGKLNTSDTYTYDPVSQSYVPSGYVPTLKANRYFELGGNLTSGATTMGYGSLAGMAPKPTPRYYGDITQTTYNGPYQPNTESSGGMGIGAKGPSRYAGDPGYGTGVPFSGAGGDSATGGGMQVGIQAADITPIIERERDAYYGLATAQQVAAQGLSEFKAVQDSILSHEGVYSDQVSEYTSQLNAQDAAYEILKQRQEDGVALTKEQTDFMNNYAEATARGTAGVEDATVAQGLLAQQYLLNMEKGDQLNASLESQTGAVGDLVTVIEDLILSLDGVPDEVRARIELDRVAESQAELQTVIDLINQIEGEHGVHFSISADGGGVSIGNPNGPTISPDLALHGGVMGYRGGGVVARMAEGNNPELLRFRGGGTALALTDGLYNVPQGTYVTPAPATKQLVGGGSTYQFYAPLTIVANDPGQFAAALQEAALGSSR